MRKANKTKTKTGQLNRLLIAVLSFWLFSFLTETNKAKAGGIKTMSNLIKKIKKNKATNYFWPYYSIEGIKAAHETVARGFFFSPEAMRFFSSRIISGVYGYRYFITSERDRSGIVWDGQRRYTVRECDYDGNINKVSELGEFATLYQAKKRAKELGAISRENMRANNYYNN